MNVPLFEVSLLIAFSAGLFNTVPTAEVSAFKNELLAHLRTDCRAAFAEINGTGKLSDAARAAIEASMESLRR